MDKLKEQEKGKLSHGAHVRPGKKSNYPGQEIETRRDGLQHQLSEKVVDAKPDHGEAHDAARKAYFQSSGRTAKGGSAKRAETGAKGAK